MNLKICLVPVYQDNEAELRLARDMQDAWEELEKAFGKKDGKAGQLGRLKFYVGNESPPCPCCGGGDECSL